MTRFKLRANIIYSRDLDIEADNITEAIDKAKQLMEEPSSTNELKPQGVTFSLLSHAIGDEGLVKTGLEDKTSAIEE